MKVSRQNVTLMAPLCNLFTGRLQWSTKSGHTVKPLSASAGGIWAPPVVVIHQVVANSYFASRRFIYPVAGSHSVFKRMNNRSIDALVLLCQQARTDVVNLAQFTSAQAEASLCGWCLRQQSQSPAKSSTQRVDSLHPVS